MGQDAAGWSLADASCWLDPPISAEQLSLLTRALGITPAGHRKPPPGSPGGRPAAVYDIAELCRLHAAVTPWLVGMG